MKKNTKVSRVMSNCIFYSFVLPFGIFWIKTFFVPGFMSKNLPIPLEGWETVAFFGGIVSMVIFIILTLFFEAIEKALKAINQVNSAIASHEEGEAVGFVKLEINHEGKKIVVLDPSVSSQDMLYALQRIKSEQVSWSYRHFLWPVYDFLEKRL